MIENQDIEFKEIWKDEYLKWICGFANSNGGVIYIGKDDHGNVIGVDNSIKLVKEIPNKIKNTLGIIPEVKVERENELSYIVIKIEKYPVPISYQGKLYLRSGSNNNEVTGAELERFMLKKVGKRWEDLPIINANMDDLNEDAFKMFKEKAVKNGRLKQEDLDIDNETLLKNLGLYDGKYINNAGMLLFGINPSRWITGAYIKIGYFGENDSDLLYQDIIEGALILQVDKVMDLVYFKYLKAFIKYEGVQRIEEYMFPREAFREIILNSINHKQYEENNPIQISVYKDKIYIWNDGLFPVEIASKGVFTKHYSKPYNPLIAQTFFKAGFIESWGRGFEKIKIECKKYGNPIPDIEISDTGVMIKCSPSKSYVNLLTNNDINYINGGINGGINDGINEVQKRILSIISKNPYMTQKDISLLLEISLRTVERNVADLREKNKIRRIGSNKNGYWEIISR